MCRDLEDPRSCPLYYVWADLDELVGDFTRAFLRGKEPWPGDYLHRVVDTHKDTVVVAATSMHFTQQAVRLTRPSKVLGLLDELHGELSARPDLPVARTALDKARLVVRYHVTGWAEPTEGNVSPVDICAGLVLLDASLALRVEDARDWVSYEYTMHEPDFGPLDTGTFG